MIEPSAGLAAEERGRANSCCAKNKHSEPQQSPCYNNIQIAQQDVAFATNLQVAQMFTRIVVPAQERSPAHEYLTAFDSENREEAVRSASSSSAGTDSSMDGKELGIELARVVNDVKVRCAPLPAVDVRLAAH